MRESNFRILLATLIVITLMLSGGLLHAGQQQQKATPPAAAAAAPASAPPPASMDEVIGKIIKTESVLVERMQNARPLIETYIQNLDKDDALTFAPKSDEYFIGKLDMTSISKGKSLLPEPGFAGAVKKTFGQFYGVKYLPEGFAQMLLLDNTFSRENYLFEYVRREFLGEVRCIVLDVKPKPGTAGTFSGRIWAEDKDYNIVRFNGTYGKSTNNKIFFHFDSWREFMGPGLWLPVYVYSEESDLNYFFGRRKLRFKAQTRLWGYTAGKSNQQNEMTAVLVQSDQVRDNVDQSDVLSPVQALRAWERHAEDNLIQRLEKAALMAPDSEVNKVIETVISNIEVTNSLSIEPEVRARVLLTSPLESFTIGNTIVLSRGLVDVLPDEASLAMIVAHELAHIALGHSIDTKYSFNDRMLFEDDAAFKSIRLKRDEKEEAEADQKAAEYLAKSPYKDKLKNAGLFLKAMDERAKQLPHLLLPHVGNTMVKGSKVQRMADLMQSAPELKTASIDQLAALPLGGRIRVDAWTGKIEMVKSKPVALQFAREKMPFEVTPVYLYLTRQSSSQTVAQSTPPAASK